MFLDDIAECSETLHLTFLPDRTSPFSVAVIMIAVVRVSVRVRATQKAGRIAQFHTLAGFCC
jgi:hypothetical protein